MISWADTTLSKIYMPLIKADLFEEISLSQSLINLLFMALEKILKLQLRRLVGLNFFKVFEAAIQCMFFDVANINF